MGSRHISTYFKPIRRACAAEKGGNNCIKRHIQRPCGLEGFEIFGIGVSIENTKPPVLVKRVADARSAGVPLEVYTRAVMALEGRRTLVVTNARYK